jgi:hypothetical protein
MKLYDTKEKKTKNVKKKGNLITFKIPFNWKGNNHKQILVQRFEKSKSGAVKIIGFVKDTQWFNSIADLLNAVDWDIMEQWHIEERRIKKLDYKQEI